MIYRKIFAANKYLKYMNDVWGDLGRTCRCGLQSWSTRWQMSPKSHSGPTFGLRMMMMMTWPRWWWQWWWWWSIWLWPDRDDDDDQDNYDDDDYKPESTDRWDREWASYFLWLSSYLQKKQIVLYGVEDDCFEARDFDDNDDVMLVMVMVVVTNMMTRLGGGSAPS